MTPVTKPAMLEEQWKKKCFEFSAQSDDNLVPVISKVIDTLAFYLKDSAHPRVQLALKTLEYERSVYFSAETTDVPSIRTMMYGIIQSIHGLLLTKTALPDSNSSEAKAILAMVGDWKMKSFALSNRSDDIILPIITKVFDAITLVLKGAEQSRIQTTLKALDYELSVCKFSENADEPSIRTLMYGVIECVHGCLLDMTALKNSVPSEEMHHHKVVDEHRMNVNKQLKKEQSIEDEIVQQSDGGFSTIPNFTMPTLVPKEESSIDPSPVLPEDNQNPVFAIHPKNEPRDEVDNVEKMNSLDDERRFDDGDMMNMNVGMENEFDDFPLGAEKEEEPVESNNTSLAPKAEKRSQRRISKPINYVNEDADADSDREEGSTIKKSRSESEEKNGKKRRFVYEDSKSVSDKKKRRVFKKSDKELKCPECTFRSNAVCGWINHLRRKHSTTPLLAGLALRCECGHESQSYLHSVKCEVANFTLIRKGKGPIRRLDDAKETPQCILCDMHPKTALGFMIHLQQHHHSTLLANGLKLKCGCGFLAPNRGSYDQGHKKQCDGRQYTLHKIDEE